MKEPQTARELEIEAAAQSTRPQPTPLCCGEAIAMLVRRGLRPSTAPLDLPFSENLDEQKSAQLSGLLGHYAFRLFLRGAIQKSGGFTPDEATQYLTRTQAWECAESLVRLGLAEPTSRGRYRLLCTAKSFGGTLEWYIAPPKARFRRGDRCQVPRLRCRRRP